MIKKLLLPDRLRHLPSQFSWVDQRLIRRRHLQDCDHSAWALYLFLTTVADAQGLSYYSDASTMRLVKLDPVQLSAARQQLIGAGLLCYQKPLYQLLALPEPGAPAADSSPSQRSGQTQSVAQVLRRALQGGGL
jgi:hypothetical protein